MNRASSALGRRDPHAHPFVAGPLLRQAHAQVVVRQHEARAVLGEGQAGTHGADLRGAETVREHGAARDELQVERVTLRIQASPEPPHAAAADFDLVRLVGGAEVSRDRWTLSLQFTFIETVEPELMIVNPMGIIITYLRGDRALVTG